MPIVKRLADISSEPPICYSTGLSGLDKILGGGIVRGSTMLAAGIPGAGKSTLLLQIADYLANNLNKKILYVAGEENQEQIKMRAERLEINSTNVLLIESTDVEEILALREELKPDIIIVDSLQMLYSRKLKSAPATPSQMKNGLLEISKMAKHTNTTVIFIGHATKTGYVAGLQTLQHMVDVVMTLTRDEETDNRVLRVSKNRFGSTEYVWNVLMTEKGLTENTMPTNGESNNLNLSVEQLDILLKGQPVWRPVVRASLNWLREQATKQIMIENQKRRGGELN